MSSRNLQQTSILVLFINNMYHYNIYEFSVCPHTGPEPSKYIEIYIDSPRYITQFSIKN